MKVYLVNDTSGKGHPGCDAVMESIRARLVAAGHKIIGVHKCGKPWSILDIEACDAVVANGEGTIHHESRGCELVMNALRMGQRFGKRTYLINSLYQVYRDCYSDVLSRLDDMIVREPWSAVFAKQHGARRVDVMLDSCVDDMILRPAKLLRDGFAYSDTDEQSDWVHRLNGDEPPYPNAERVPADFYGGVDFQSLVDAIGSYELYITGRHHGVYAAMLAGTPFIAVPSNSHKIESFIDWTGLPIPIWRDQPLDRLVDFALGNRWMYEKLFEEFLLTKEWFKGELRE